MKGYDAKTATTALARCIFAATLRGQAVCRRKIGDITKIKERN
ncbi:MAG: hypothetical protein ACI8PB_002451 [Desulforhopalus sp.]|jgi:hypothetical protein